MNQPDILSAMQGYFEEKLAREAQQNIVSEGSNAS